MKKWGAVIGILISLVVLVAILSRVDLRGAANYVRGVGWGNWWIGVGIYLSAFLPRGWRWKLMLPESERLPWWWVTKSVIIGYAANNLLPFRLGELVRSYMVGERFSVSKLTCLATVGAEKVLDGCCLLGFLAACLPFIQMRSESAAGFHRMFLLASGLFGIAIGVCFLLAFADQQARRCAERFFPASVARVVGAGLSALTMFRRWKIVLQAAVLTAVVWMIEGFCFVFFTAKIGVTNPWAAGIFCLVVVNLSILIPSAPGYVGVFQAGAVAAFLALGMNASQGLALGAVTHAAQFIPTTLAGLALASAMGLNWSRLYHLKDE